MTVSVAVFGVSAPAVGQPPPSPRFQTEVDVRQVVPEDVDETPGAAASLTAEDLLKLRPFTMHDAFGFIPGVFTIDDDVLARRSGIGIRGAPSRRSRKTLLLEDGVPINASTYLDPSTHYTPPLDRLERVDVLKGAGHVVHGPLNNHGIVNFRNKRAMATPETVVDAGVGNAGVFRRHLLHRQTFGRLGVVGSYTGSQADGVFDVERHQFDDVFGSLHWAVGARHEVGVSANYLRERARYDESNLTPQEFAVAPRTKRPGQEHNTLAVDFVKVDLVHHARAGTGFGLSTRAFYTDLDRPRVVVDLGESPIAILPAVEASQPFVAGRDGRMVGRLRQYRTMGADHRMEHPGLTLLGRPHVLQWGVRAEHHMLADLRSAGATGEILRPSSPGPIVRDHDFRAGALSAFVLDTVHFGRATVSGGLRVEHYTQHKTRNPSIDEPSGRPRESDAHTLALPSLSVLMQVLQETALFANVGRGYTPAFARTAAGFPLRPETGWNTQVGVRTARFRGTTVEGAWFYNRIVDTVVQLPYSIEEQNVFINSEHSTSSGVEAGAQVNSAAWIASRYNGFVRSTYTHMRAEFTSGMLRGLYVPEIPRHVGNTTVGIEHGAGWHVSATATWVAAFTTDLANTRAFTLADEDGVPLGPDDEFDLRETIVLGTVPSHVLLSARASVRLAGTPVTLWMQGQNLANRLYITDLTNGLRPGGRRTVTVGARVQF